MIDKEMMKEMYPEGTEVICEEMNDPYGVKPGTKGKVMYIDDAGIVHVSWETGSSLGLVYGVDKWRVA